eukprot:COSAG05_NODE_259_length_12737_cov_42.436145_10_plen_87_part_00
MSYANDDSVGGDISVSDDDDDNGSASGGLSAGAMVSISGLTSPRSQHLNDSTTVATLIEWLPTQDRYRMSDLKRVRHSRDPTVKIQ